MCASAAMEYCIDMFDGHLPFLPKLESAIAISSPQGHSETETTLRRFNPQWPCKNRPNSRMTSRPSAGKGAKVPCPRRGPEGWERCAGSDR